MIQNHIKHTDIGKLKTNIIPWIDVFKGLGMLLVVAGHVYVGKISHTIFIFHMPLFFYISGYLFKPTKAYKKYFAKKVVHLLIPYFCFFIPLYIFFVEYHAIETKEIIIYFLSPAIGGIMLGGALSVFWFVTCLFLTQQVMNVLITKLNSKIILPVILFMLILSFLNMNLFSKFWLPWNAHIIFSSAPIFYIGYIFKNKNFKINNIILLALGLAVILFSNFYPENVYDMKYAKYGIPGVTLVSSIILILNLQLIAIKLSKFKFSCRILSEIGKASMVIMYLHQTIQILIGWKISTNETIRFLMATILSYTIYLIFSRFKISKALFLGSYRDLKDIYSFGHYQNKSKYY